MVANIRHIVVFARVIEDKQDGVYISGVYFGGLSGTKEGADEIAHYCVNNMRGGIIIPKIFKTSSKNDLLNIMDEARKRFWALEQRMIEAEDIMQRNQERTKK